MTLRTLGFVAAGVVVAFAAGWWTGASGRATALVEWSRAEIRADVAEVRAAVLDAQLSLAGSNFGDARRSLQRAHTIGTRLQDRLREAGQPDRAGQVGTVLTQLERADQLSGALDASAAAAAGEALRTLESSIPTAGQ